MKAGRLAMACRLVLGYAFVCRESEQNCSHLQNWMVTGVVRGVLLTLSVDSMKPLISNDRHSGTARKRRARKPHSPLIDVIWFEPAESLRHRGWQCAGASSPRFSAA